jgi:hypothetical protein
MKNFGWLTIPAFFLLFSNLFAPGDTNAGPAPVPAYLFSACTFSSEKGFDTGVFERDCVDASLQRLSPADAKRALLGQEQYLCRLITDVHPQP